MPCGGDPRMWLGRGLVDHVLRHTISRQNVFEPRSSSSSSSCWQNSASAAVWGILKCGLAQGQLDARAALTSNQFLRFPQAQLRFLSAHFPNRFWKPKQAAKASVVSCQSCNNCRQSDWTQRDETSHDARPHTVASSKVNAFKIRKQSTVYSFSPRLSKDDTRVSWRCLCFRSVCDCNHRSRREGVGGEVGHLAKSNCTIYNCWNCRFLCTARIRFWHSLDTHHQIGGTLSLLLWLWLRLWLWRHQGAAAAIIIKHHVAG